MLDALIALAVLAGNTIVTAATTDAWEAARGKVARWFGRGEAKKEELAATRLDQTRQQLQSATGQELEQARADLAKVWQLRIADLLEEEPGAEAELRLLIDEAVIHGNVAPPDPTQPGPATS
jgi:hypothetical protein